MAKQQAPTIELDQLYFLLVELLVGTSETAAGDVEGMPYDMFARFYNLMEPNRQADLDRLVEVTDGWAYIP